MQTLVAQIKPNFGYLNSIPFDKHSFEINNNVNILNTIISFANKFIDTSIVNNVSVNSSNINESGLIPSKRLRWWINVPVQLNANNKTWIKISADSAADKPCVNFYWAYKHFKQYIVKDRKPTTLATPNGKITPQYCLHLSFPANDGITYKAKFLLLKDLPASILVDIIMLIAFGYKFQNEISTVNKSTS